MPPGAPRVVGMATANQNLLIPGIPGTTGITGMTGIVDMPSTADSMTDSAADTTT